MPVYNAGDRLKVALKCALNQTVESFEVIAVNDGSTDTSAEILKEYEAQYPHKLRVITTLNGGAARARNTGLKAAAGKWIYFCDADDEFSLDICAFLIDLAEKSDAQIATCGMKRIANGVENPHEFLNCRTDCETQTIGRDEVFKRWLMPLFRINKTDFAIAHGYLPLCIFRLDIINQNNIVFATDIAVHEDESFFLQYLNFVDRATLSRKAMYNYIYCDSSASAKFFAGRVTRTKVENNYWLAARMRVRFWEKFFGRSVGFKYGLCELYSSELKHRLMAVTSQSSLKITDKFAAFVKILKEEKSTERWKIVVANTNRLPFGKRLFLTAVKIGIIPTFIFCVLLAVIKK